MRLWPQIFVKADNFGASLWLANALWGVQDLQDSMETIPTSPSLPSIYVCAFDSCVQQEPDSGCCITVRIVHRSCANISHMITRLTCKLSIVAPIRFDVTHIHGFASYDKVWKPYLSCYKEALSVVSKHSSVDQTSAWWLAGSTILSSMACSARSWSPAPPEWHTLFLFTGVMTKQTIQTHMEDPCSNVLWHRQCCSIPIGSCLTCVTVMYTNAGCGIIKFMYRALMCERPWTGCCHSIQKSVKGRSYADKPCQHKMCQYQNLCAWSMHTYMVHLRIQPEMPRELQSPLFTNQLLHHRAYAWSMILPWLNAYSMWCYWQQ